MSRRSSITTHPQREAIEQALAQGVPGAQLARQYGLSESAISRHRISRIDVIAATLNEDAPAPTDIVARLLDVAEDARQTRKLAALSGTPVTRARAQSAEVNALDKLVKLLGITDTTVVELAQGTVALVRTLQRVAERNPGIRADLIAEMRTHEELDELADDLAALLDRIKK